MGEITEPAPVLLIMAIFSRYDTALDWAQKETEARWGPIVLASEVFPFTATSYYQASMGPDLLKRLLAFERLIRPEELVAIKLTSNQLEQNYTDAVNHSEARSLNIDPGYLTANKLVLASTKDAAARIHLAQGIYAEVTLHYADRAWQEREWTYPDFRQIEYKQFFNTCRALLSRLSEG